MDTQIFQDRIALEQVAEDSADNLAAKMIIFLDDGDSCVWEVRQAVEGHADCVPLQGCADYLIATLAQRRAVAKILGRIHGDATVQGILRRMH